MPRFVFKDLWIYISLLTLSCATFLFEITLTRLFAIAHFYHFAFMVVSLALLGTGASGSFLSLFPVIGRENIRRVVPAICAGCGFSILSGYLLFDHVPFDSYAVAIDPRQNAVFLMHLLALSAPFFFTGLCVNGLMKCFPKSSSQIYAVNLAGSALGCLLALLILPILAGEGVVCACAALAALAGLFAFVFSAREFNWGSLSKFFNNGLTVLVCVGLLLAAAPEVWRRSQGKQGEPFFSLYLSPYKSLSYALQYPGAYIEETLWNAFSRVDVVRSRGIHSLPGLSYLYPDVVSAEPGLFVDGDNLSPVLPMDTDAGFFGYLPQSLAYRLRPSAKALVLEPRGGLDLLASQAGGATAISAVEPNPLLVQEAGEVYKLPNMKVSIESPRSFLRRDENTYDVIVLSLASTYHPVTSGAYSLGEDYKYTLESIQDAMARLNPDGILVLSRWLQVPPSEFLRAFILVVEALENEGLDPWGQIAAIRGYNLGTLFVKRTPFLEEELDEVRAFAESRAFDLVYLPGIQPGESNRFNILPEDEYYKTFTGYLKATDRDAWLDAYPYNVSPPVDERPFFDHFFKWSQVKEVLAAYGKTWQPFGGAGYLVVVFLLVVVLILSTLFILLPVLVGRLRRNLQSRHQPEATLRGRALVYFLLLGFGFMAIEMPLIQKLILFLGQPAYSFSAVLFTLLLASGLGSLFSRRVKGWCLLILGVVAGLSPLWLGAVMTFAMGWTLPLRLLTVLACLAPLGFLMGVPFPKGIAAVQAKDPNLIPWLWAVNSAASVVASVLAAMLALSFGFIPLLVSGGCCYLLAYVLLGRL